MKVGEKAKEFAVVDQDGTEVTLTGLLDDGPLVLYFYIKAMTPG
jgi:peroxiredoxin Q/BCP